MHVKVFSTRGGAAVVLSLWSVTLLAGGLADVPTSSASSGGSSLRFHGNGVNDVDRVKIAIDAPHRPADIGAGDFTIEWWMKALPSENGSNTCTSGGDNWIFGNIILDRDVFGSGDFGDYGISMFDGRLAFGVDRLGSGNTICDSRNVRDGVWHHVAVTRRGSDGELRVFVDGVAGATGFGPIGDVRYQDGRSTSYPNSDPFLVIGAEKHDAGSLYPSYAGWVDELRLSTALRYAASFSPPAAPFVADAQTAALYHFDEAAGTTIGDSSGAAGGPSTGVRSFGGSPAGPEWSTDTPFATAVGGDVRLPDGPSGAQDAGNAGRAMSVAGVLGFSISALIVLRAVRRKRAS